jgi:PAS domain S-box-containing protein
MNKHRPSSSPRALHRRALQIAGIYLILGILWILFSDQIAARISSSEETLAIISLYKGWVYVLVTALLLYGLLLRQTTRLHAGEMQLQRVLDALPALVSYIDKDQRYRFTNRAYQDWFEGETLGKHIREVVGVPAYQSALPYVEKVLSGETVRYETAMLLPAGERSISAIYVPDIGTNGQVEGFFTLVHDVTDQKQVLEEQRQWADAFEGCAHGIAIADPNTNRIIVCNPSFAKLHKSRVDDIVGTAILSLYAASDHEHVRHNVQKADQIGYAHFEAKMTRRGKDRSIFPAEIDVVSILGEDGEVLHRVVTAQDISERKQAQEKLKESEAKYRTLVEYLPAITYISGSDQYVGVSYISPQIESLGFDRDVWIADPDFWFKHIHPDDQQQVGSKLQQFQEGAESFKTEYRLMLPNGEARWFHDESIRVKDRSGKTILKQGFMLDITEYKLAERALYESEERYRVVSELTSDYAYKDRVEADGSIVPEWITESFTRITGYTLEETRAPGFWQRLVHPEDVPLLFSHMEKIFSGQPHTLETRIITKSGGVRWLRDYATPFWDAKQERVAGLHGAVQDITEYKQVEEKLRLQARWLEQIHDAVITFDLNLLITAWNPAAERVYGWKAEEVIGKKGEEILRSEFFSKTRAEVITELKESGEFSAEITQLQKDGSRIHVETRTATLHDERGHPVGYVSVNRDITERKLAEQENISLARFPAENPNPMMRATHQGILIYANEASAALLEDWGVQVGDSLPEDWVERIQEIIRTGSGKTMDVSCGEKTYSIMIVYALDANDVNIYGRDITDHLQMQTAALESEIRYHRLLDSMMEGAQIIGFDWRYIYLNPVAASQGRQKTEELLGRTMMDVYPGIERTELFSVLRQCMAERISRRLENQFVFPDGRFGWFELSIQPAEEGIFILSTDITERKQGEEYLRRFELLSKHSRDIILFMGHKDGRILEANKAAIQAYGYHRDELLALTIQDLRAPDTRSLTTEQMAQADAEGILFETIHQRKDGTNFPVEVSSQGATIGDKRMLISIIRDITERKQIEQELQAAHDKLEIKVQERTAALSQANALLQALMDNLPDHIYFKDTQSRFIRNSKSQATSLRLSDPSEVVGKTDFDFFPHAEKSYAEEQEVMRSGKPLVDFEEWVVWPDGRETWVLTTKLPLRNSEGQTIGIFGISHDITERKRAEQAIHQLNADLRKQAEQLQVANKELEAFSYSVSHDLRAPLRAIDGYTRILVEDYDSILDEEGKRICGVISREARRMGQLIDDLLAFSRLGRKEMFTSKIEMRVLVTSVLNELLKEEERERIDLNIADLPVAKGDSSLLRQVWMNLLANAIKFTSKKERAVIEVGGKATEDELIYYVRDNGAGFEMEYANKLFGVFQRLHSESEFTGTGVGLAIVQRIIHRHDGRVWAEGDVEGGAIFYFALPRKENFS